MFLLGLLALPGCGFGPAYGPGGPAAVPRGRVAVAAPASPDGFHLRVRLEDRLGAAGPGAAVLTVEPLVEEVGGGVTPTGAITRYRLDGQALWRLASASGTVLAEGEATGFTGYSATGATVAARAAAEDARERLMTLLADEVVAQLLLSGARP